MTREEFDAYCKTLKASTHVVQWGGASVWKVGGKVFAIAPLEEASAFQRITFKCSELSFEILKEQDGFIPAPYLARGQWIQVLEQCAMSDDQLKAFLNDSYDIIKAKLTKAMRTELSL